MVSVSTTSNSHDVAAEAARGARKEIWGGLMGGRSWALLSNRAGVARAGNYSVVTRKSVIVETARSQMVDTNWMDFSRISWVEDDDGTVMGECGSGDVVVGSKSGTATAAVGATAMDGAGGERCR